MKQRATKARLKRLVIVSLWLIPIVNVYPVGNIILLVGNHFLYVTRYGQWIEEWQFFGWRYEDRIEAFDEY